MNQNTYNWKNNFIDNLAVAQMIVMVPKIFNLFPSQPSRQIQIFRH